MYNQLAKEVNEAIVFSLFCSCPQYAPISLTFQINLFLQSKWKTIKYFLQLNLDEQFPQNSNVTFLFFHSFIYYSFYCCKAHSFHSFFWRYPMQVVLSNGSFVFFQFCFVFHLNSVSNLLFPLIQKQDIMDSNKFQKLNVLSNLKSKKLVSV